MFLFFNKLTHLDFTGRLNMDIAIINTWLLTFKGDSLGIVKNGAIGVEGNKRIRSKNSFHVYFGHV